MVFIHSFRHLVADHLYKASVMESMIEALTGRAGKTELRKRYTKGYRVQTLYEPCVLKLNYELDLSGLTTESKIKIRFTQTFYNDAKMERLSSKLLHDIIKFNML